MAREDTTVKGHKWGIQMVINKRGKLTFQMLPAVEFLCHKDTNRDTGWNQLWIPQQNIIHKDSMKESGNKDKKILIKTGNSSNNRRPNQGRIIFTLNLHLKSLDILSLLWLMIRPMKPCMWHRPLKA